jgi:predicted nucleotidyltransferase component of viral defense system
MARENYAAQVSLLVRLLPTIAKQDVFALKGGTAINLFYRDLPRLSVDIDLTYLPIQDRATSLAGINAAMERIKTDIDALPAITATRIAGGGGGATRVQARTNTGTMVKIETSPVTRGTVFPPNLKRVAPKVEAEFGFAEMNLISFEDLYGGKLHAALDRQHPRDLFDIKQLYENEGLTDDLFRAFLIYVICSPRPPHELLNPNLGSLEETYIKEFVGMSAQEVSLQELEDVRVKLIADIQSRLSGSAADFLRSVQRGEPDFGLIDLPNAKNLPAIKWKLQNLDRLITDNPQKHAKQSMELETLF